MFQHFASTFSPNFFFVFLPHGLHLRAHRPAGALFEELRSRNMFVRYFKGPRTGDRLRITVGTDAEMDALLAALAELDR